jgi:membrane protein DedA with SNARE-associated domain
MERKVFASPEFKASRRKSRFPRASPKGKVTPIATVIISVRLCRHRRATCRLAVSRPCPVTAFGPKTMSRILEYLHDYLLTYGYPVLFLGVLLENAGIPVPGETAVLLAGFLASAASGHVFNIWIVIAITVLAATLGDNIGYWLGREFARPRLQNGKGFLFLTPRTLQVAEGYFQRYGVWTIFFARFITGIRVIGALAAGTAGMPWPRFFLANASGALLWATTISLLGYFFGENWERLEKWLGRGGLIALALVLLIGIPYLWRRLRGSGNGRGSHAAAAHSDVPADTNAPNAPPPSTQR